MKLDFSGGKITIEKELNSLDRFVIEFCSILEKLKIKYVIISGYVAILFGRNRSSEDIDVFIEKINFEKFADLWKELNKKFECIITEKIKNAYADYLDQNHALRFSQKGSFIPNMEIKFPKVDLDVWTLKNRKEVFLNSNQLFISPIELQVSFKLFLGSEKDIEDARYLYRIFKEKINRGLIKEFNRKLNISNLFDKYIK